MAWIQTRPKKNGKKTFTVTIRLKGLPTQTATFDRLTDARNWSNSMESALKEGYSRDYQEMIKTDFMQLQEEPE